MIGSGCVKKVMAAWVGNVISWGRLQHEAGCRGRLPRTIEIEITRIYHLISLHAGALGIPFIPTKALGTGMIQKDSPLRRWNAPTPKKNWSWPALKLMWLWFKPKRADEEEILIFWGGSGGDQRGGLAHERCLWL